MPKIRPKFTVHSDQYGPVVIEADGKAHTRNGEDWFLRADAPELADGESITGVTWSPQMGGVITTSAGRALSHNLGHVAEWRQEV